MTLPTLVQLLALVMVGAAVAVLRWVEIKGPEARSQVPKLAGRGAVRRAAGRGRLARTSVRPRPTQPGDGPGDLGFYLGTSRGVRCYSSVEDSTVVLGPPRSGKGLHLVVPMALDAPGPALVTSTRPDVLAITARHRADRRPGRGVRPAGFGERRTVGRSLVADPGL